MDAKVSTESGPPAKPVVLTPVLLKSGMNSTQDEMADENVSQNDQEFDEMSFSEKVRACLEAAGYNYEFFEEDNTISVNYWGNNSNELKMYIISNENENGEAIVKFLSASLGTFDEDSFLNGIKICNELNQKYNWVKFFIYEDYSLLCSYDEKYSDNSILNATDCIQMVLNIFAIIDDAYPDVMRGRWGQ